MAVRIRIFTLAWLLPCCVVAAGAAHAQSSELYQWKDAQGVSHYSDAPPPGGQYQARTVHTREGVAPAPAAEPVTTAASANCTLARTNLERLKAGGDIGLDADRDGTPDATLSAEQRAQQTRLAEANIRTFCAGSTPAATP